MYGIIDMHCDTLFEAYMNRDGLRSRSGHVNLEKLAQNGCMAQCFAAFLPPGERGRELKIELGAYELFQELYACYQRELAANRDLILPAVTVADIQKNAAVGMPSAILTVEDSGLLEGKLSRIDELAQKGVRMMTLTWNDENCLGYPCRENAKEHDRGLTSFGIEAIGRMNEAGIVVDVSHLSAGGFSDVVRYNKKPFAASHSCARSLCGHHRNLSDEQLRLIGEAGGVVGINFYSVFLTEGSSFADNSRIIEHLLHVVNKAGIEAAAWGSDFDGIECELEMKGYQGFPRLIGQLSAFFSDDDIEKICSGNFLRVLAASE